MNSAIRYRRNWAGSNTMVRVSKEVVEVFLHGNQIASVDTATNDLTLFDGGWQSVTTKSRLNALINEFCDAFTCGVYQKDFTWYVTDRGTTHQFDSTQGYLFQ